MPTATPDLKNRSKLDAVMDAVSSIELTETPAWSDLDSLSTHTNIEDIEAVPEGIFETVDNGFTAVATVYVGLNYGDKVDAVSVSDSFPAQVHGHFEQGDKAVVDSVSVDTGSFYE
jgi:hypothetical protein